MFQCPRLQSITQAKVSIDRSTTKNDKLILELVHVAYKNVVKLNVFAPWLCVYLYQVDNLYAGESTPLLSHRRT